MTAVSSPSLAPTAYGTSPYKENTRLNYSVISLAEFSLSGNPLLQATGIYLVADIVGFLISLATGWHVHLDLIGTGAFALASIPNIFTSQALHQKWSSIAVSVWGVKLAGFLFYRAAKVGHDMRLEEMLSTPSGAFQFWFVTFLWNVFCSLPYTLGMMSTRTDSAYVKAGGVIYLIGLLIETVADGQKWFFKQSNPGKFCNVGLWAFSQHPNFFGNLVLWAGIFVMNIPALINPSAGVFRFNRLLLALLSPLFMWTLFNGQAQGTVTNAKTLMETKYGSDPAFQKYIEEVPKIFPKFW